MEKYLALKNTSLWYNGTSTYDYGFIHSVDNTTKTISSYRRYIIDNLIPIFLLGENFIDSAKDELEDVFALINSTQFWDNNSKVFYHFNSSTGEIYAIDNLYAVLANLLINQTDALNDDIQLKAGQLADQTMETLTEVFWDNTNMGYDYSASSGLSITNDSKNLETNALGVITLLEYWKMSNKDEYLTNATLLFDKIQNSSLWCDFGSFGAYLNWSSHDWSNNITDIADLKANSLMMRASLELFEISGNGSYHQAAIELYNTFENVFYDYNYNAYAKSKSINTGLDSDKNLLYNLRVCETYMYALKTYENSCLSCSFNKSEQLPEFIIDQDNLVITTNYSYNSIYATYDIPNATITYTIRYPNGTIADTLSNTTNENGTHTLSYFISNELPIGVYSISVLVNKSFFEFKNLSKSFDITSGIRYNSGLEDEDWYYQGTTHNITIKVNNTRASNINLNFTIEADSILINSPQSFLLNNSQLNNITGNFMIRNDALPGNYSFHFLLKSGNDVYLDYMKIIEVKNALQITNLIYDSKVVKGDVVEINLTATNFLQNASQSFNLSVSGEYIQNVQNQEYSLSLQEKTIISNDYIISENINSNTIEVDIVISKGDTINYNKSIVLQLINAFEVIDCYFSESVSQASPAYLILVIKSNKKSIQDYSLSINDKRFTGSLLPGENTIIKTVIPTLNPYDFSTKTYSVFLYDGNSNEIYRNQFLVKVNLSVMYLVLCYILPIVVPIIIVIYLKNKQVKIDRLRRR